MSEPLRKYPSLLVGMILVGLLVLVAVLGPTLVPHSVTVQDLDAQLLRPSRTHWMGTDDNGLAVMAAIAHGTRLGLQIALAVLLVTGVIGTTLGLLCGVAGGAIDEAIMRFVDAVQAFPGILLNIFIVSL